MSTPKVVSELLARSNKLGAEPRFTNYAGGNTSAKGVVANPATGKDTTVLWVKGSGGDLGTLKEAGLAALDLEKFKDLVNVYPGVEREDEMVALFDYCAFGKGGAAPSIDTSMHGLVEFDHVDHLHPDSIIALATSKDGKKLTADCFGEEILWVDWRRPGFQLGLDMAKIAKENPKAKGCVLGGHGLTTWGVTSKECEERSIWAITKAEEFIKAKGKADPFGKKESKFAPLDSAKRKERAAALAPYLRGIASKDVRMLGSFTDNDVVLDFLQGSKLMQLASLGTSCPDHFLRTKISPMVLDTKPDAPVDEVIKRANELHEAYRKNYAAYYDRNAKKDSPAMRGADPLIILVPGVGMFSYGKDKQTARVAGEFYINAINVMRGAEAITSYTSLPRQEAFDIEYWLLEEAKLQRMPKEKPLSRKVAVITGAGGGIGKAIADKLAAEGANVVLTDINEESLITANGTYARDISTYAVCDVTNTASIESAYKKAIIEFGGVDIIVHSAGLAISKPLTDTTDKDWNILQSILVKGQFDLAKQFALIVRKQGLGGDYIAIASKNGLVAGPNNVAYGTAKAAQQHMVRLLAAELAKDKVRVNTVNPDGVIVGSKIWEGAWAEGRAKANGITVEELPAFYAKRNLLNEIITPSDIANGVFSFVGILDKSTGNIINVDGGMANAFVR